MICETCNIREVSGRKGLCSECYRERANARSRVRYKEWYSNNTQKAIKKANDKNKSIKKLAIDLKTGKPCMDCKNIYHYSVMEWDHVKGVKINKVSALANQSSRIALLEEIAKCELVCANCHRMRTWNRNHKT